MERIAPSMQECADGLEGMRSEIAALLFSPAKYLDAALTVPKLSDYRLLLSVRGHLLFELGRCGEAAASFRAALECPCSEPERRFLKSKLEECESGPPSD